MQQTEKQKLLNALNTGIVTVTFEKVGTGELRIMPCTLSSDVLKENGVDVKVEMNAESDHFACWALDKKAWSSFRLDTVKQWDTN